MIRVLNNWHSLLTHWWKNYNFTLGFIIFQTIFYTENYSKGYSSHPVDNPKDKTYYRKWFWRFYKKKTYETP